MTTLIKNKNINYEKIYFYSVIIFAFTMPFARGAISFFSIFFPIIWLLEGDFKRKFAEIKASKILIIFLIFYTVIALSAILSDNTKTALKFFRLYAYWFTLIVLATSVKKEWVQKIITAFLYGMFVSELVAYGIYFELWEYGVGSKTNPSPFMFHIDYSIYLAFTSILLFSRIISKGYSLKDKIFMSLFFISTTSNLFLQTGRTGQVAYIAAIIVMFFLVFKINFKSILYSLFSLIVIYALAFNFSNSFKMRVEHTIADIKSISSGNLHTSWGQRLAFFAITYETLKKYPIFGIGLGDFEEEAAIALQNPKFDNYPAKMKAFMSSNHFHNQFLMSAMQMGIIGLAFTIAIYFLAFKKAFQTNSSEYKNIFTLFMVIYTIGSFADPLWNKQFTVFIWILIMSLMIALNKQDKKD
ncbi:O-antigen ligase family protein [Campylobacter sp. 9BO]|uniref:O-antigen ligase family protein n=1 Tax=Campylobacter sp. 9BO TaxID=3424759 RepID=UPI003D32E10C